MNKKGQALVEYVLIIAVISTVTIALVSYLGGFLKDYVTKTSCSLVDEVYVEGSSPGEGTCKQKGNS
jgi:Flp pilus assembly pilin Flp